MNKNLKTAAKILAAILAANILLTIINQYFFENSLEFKTASRILLSLFTLLFISKFEFLKELRPSKKTFIFSFLSLFLFVVSIFNVNSSLIATGFVVSTYNHAIFILSCLAIGIFEELLFRVFLYQYTYKFIRKDIIFSLLFCSILFGIAHLSNLVFSDYYKISIINQVLFAISIGLLLQSIYIKTKSVVLIVFLHAIINYLGSYKKNILTKVVSTSETYTFEDFLTSFISILLLTFLVIIPISYFLIKKELKKA